MKKQKFFAVFILLAIFLVGTGSGRSSYNKNPDFSYNGLIVTFKKGVFYGGALSIAQSMSMRIRHHYREISRIKGNVILCLEPKDKRQFFRLFRELKGHPGVLEVAPDYRVWAVGEPNDPLFPQQWGLCNTGQTGGTTDVDVDAPEAWEKYTGSQGVIVAVLDSGVDYSHPDLTGNMWINPGEIAGNRIDDDGNGYVDDIYGINAVKGSGNPMDDSGHGTHCAGIIGAVSDNALGVAGINRQVSLMSVKFLNPCDLGRLSDLLESLDYVITMRSTYGQNIVAINGSYAHNGFVQAEKDAIDAAGELGIIFCAAAGNNGNDNDTYPVYPACYESSNIISVTAVDHFGDLYYNWGLNTVDLAAPGVNIISTVSHYIPAIGDVVFDDAESGGNSAWITGGTFPWSITTEEDRTLENPDYPVPSPTHFWADSPGTNYSNNADNWLEWGGAIDLTSYGGQDLRLGFWTAYFFESGQDGCSLDFSNDGGVTWSSIFDFGDLGEPWYWDSYNFLITEEFKTSQFRFRFHLYADESTEFAGFNLDNIGIGITGFYGYQSMSGTSMAAPHVAGAIALLAGQYPGDTIEQRMGRVLDNVKHLDSLAGKCVTGGMLSLATALGSPEEPNIRVTVPVGGTSFSPGQNLTASWEASGIEGDVTIVLRKDDGSEKYVIGTAPWDQSSFTFQIPAEANSGFYLVRVRQGTVKNDSGIFSIIPAVPTLFVIAPSGGTFNAGESLQVDWIDAGISGNLQVILRKSDGTWKQELDSAAPYDVSPRTYHIPCALSGGNYFVRVKNDLVRGDSPEITINPTATCISLSSPRGGESFARGGQVTIAWDSTGIGGTVRVVLRRADGTGGYVVNAAAPYDGSPIYYTIPQDVIPSQYFIRVKQDAYEAESGIFNIN